MAYLIWQSSRALMNIFYNIMIDNYINRYDSFPNIYNMNKCSIPSNISYMYIRSLEECWSPTLYSPCIRQYYLPSFGNSSRLLKNSILSHISSIYIHPLVRMSSANFESRSRARDQMRRRFLRKMKEIVEAQVGVSWPEALIIASIVVVNVRHCAANGL